MSDPNLLLVMTELIASQKETNESIKETNKAVNHLSSSVDKLITDNKVREEKDKYQEEKNKAFAAHISSNMPTINRLKLALSTWDKVKVPLIVGFIVLILTALKINFAG